MDKSVKTKQLMRGEVLKNLKIVNFEEFFPTEVVYTSFGVSLLSTTKDEENKLSWRRISFEFTRISSLILGVLSFARFLLSLHSSELLEDAAESLTYADLLLGGFIASNIVFTQRPNSFRDIIERLKINFPHTRSEQVLHKIESHLNQILLIKKLLTPFIPILTGPLVVSFGFQLYEFLVMENANFQFVMKIYWPLNDVHPLAHVVLNIYIIFTEFLNTTTIFIMILLFCEICALLTIEFSVVAHKMSQIDPSKCGECYALNEMREVIKMHNSLIKIVEEFQDNFKIILLIYIAGLIQTSCCTAFLTTADISSTYTLIKYMLFPIIMMLNGFCVCLCGDRLQKYVKIKF
jgi:hypothetical protein